MLSRKIVTSLVLVASSAFYFAMGMVYGRGHLDKTAPRSLLLLYGVAAAALIHALLWGFVFLLRGIAKAEAKADAHKGTAANR